MKHTLSVTLTLVALFVAAQLIGVLIISKYVDVQKSLDSGKTEFKSLPEIGGVQIERPDVAESISWLYLFVSIIIGTLILLLLIHFGAVWFWKAWFVIAISISLFIAFGAFLPAVAAFVCAVVVAVAKLLKPTTWWRVILQNVGELFLYGGLAAIFVPILDLPSISILLLIVSGYDMYAVWKSKHMVKMAKFQMDSGVFAGLSIPYHRPEEVKKSMSKVAKANVVERNTHTAVLGGGDVAIPLLFTGTVFKFMGLTPALLIIPFTTIALALLLYLAKKDRFYPAMPFLSAGAFIGYAVVYFAHII